MRIILVLLGLIAGMLLMSALEKIVDEIEREADRQCWFANGTQHAVNMMMINRRKKNNTAKGGITIYSIEVKDVIK